MQFITKNWSVYIVDNMKWILIIILISVIMLISYAVSQQYKDKYDFYYNLKLFLNQFKINLSFKQAKVNEFLQNLKPRKYFKSFVEAYQNYLKAHPLNLDDVKILDETEKNELKYIIERIGKNDSRSEINQIEQFLCTVDEQLTKAEKDKNKLCPMIIKLSLLFAVALSILLI